MAYTTHQERPGPGTQRTRGEEGRLAHVDSRARRDGSGCSGCLAKPALLPFTMAFQPIVDVADARVVAHEALVRGLAHEGAGVVLSQIGPDTLYAFDQACRVKAIEMAARLKMPGRLNINFLPNAVYEPRACIRATLEAAARTGFPAHRLTFEIVETETIAERGHLRRITEEYRRQGFRIALDDFGTGYSGLARLADLRPDIVKLDRALVAGCDKDPVRLAIIASMVSLGAAIGTRVVVEGVEHVDEARALLATGARYMQGFLFSRPIFEGLWDGAELARLSSTIRSG